jgi:glutamate transport system permease protein
VSGELARGLLTTLELTVLAFAGALVIGTLVAIFRVSPIVPLRVFGWLYVEAFRNVPLLVLLVLFVFGLPNVGLLYGLFTTAAVAMALYAGAIVCETVRSGIRGVPLGQVEAARALGFTFTQTLRHVVLPQAFRAMVQPIGNVFIGVLLSTALAAAVAVPELTYAAQDVARNQGAPIGTFAITGALYAAVALGGAFVFGRIERRARIHR